MKKRFWILWTACMLIFAGSIYYYSAYMPKEASNENISMAETLTTKTEAIIEETDEYKISVEYPKFIGVDGTIQANDIIFADMNQSIANFKSLVTEMGNDKDIPITAKNELLIKYEMMFQDNDMVSVKFENFSYIRGSAHPFTEYSGFSYVFSTKKEVTLDDFFPQESNYLAKISERADVKLKIQLGDSYIDEFVKQGIEPKPENFKEFYLGKDGITFIFNTYQVAAYVAGPQFVFFPWSEIEDLLEISTQ